MRDAGLEVLRRGDVRGRMIGWGGMERLLLLRGSGGFGGGGVGEGEWVIWNRVSRSERLTYRPCS